MRGIRVAYPIICHILFQSRCSPRKLTEPWRGRITWGIWHHPVAESLAHTVPVRWCYKTCCVGGPAGILPAIHSPAYLFEKQSIMTRDNKQLPTLIFPFWFRSFRKLSVQAHINVLLLVYTVEIQTFSDRTSIKVARTYHSEVPSIDNILSPTVQLH